MKRDEAIWLIADILTDQDLIRTYDLGEKILTKLEESGMLPPEQPNCGCGGYHECYKWEKE